MYAKLTFSKHLYQQNVQNLKIAKNLPYYCYVACLGDVCVCVCLCVCVCGVCVVCVCVGVCGCVCVCVGVWVWVGGVCGCVCVCVCVVCVCVCVVCGCVWAPKDPCSIAAECWVWVVTYSEVLTQYTSPEAVDHLTAIMTSHNKLYMKAE